MSDNLRRDKLSTVLQSRLYSFRTFFVRIRLFGHIQTQTVPILKISVLVKNCAFRNLCQRESVSLRLEKSESKCSYSV